MMMVMVVVVVVTLMLTAVLVTVVGKSDSPRHWVSQVRGRGIERDQEGSRSENCHLLFIVDYPFLVMYYLSDKKGAGLQIETLIHYVLNSILISLCHISVFCLCFCFCLIFALVFVLFGFAQVAGSSFRESAQVSNFLKMWQKHKIRHRRDCSSRSRSSKFEICGSSTALQALLLQHHLGLKIFTLITKHRQESKSSLQ